MDSVRTRSGWAFLVLLSCAFLGPPLAICQLQRPEACHSCVPDFIREELAIGFHLGQSYGVAVNLLDNGTAVSLAKVPGSRRYIELIERLMTTLAPRYAEGPNGIGEILAWAAWHLLGIPPSSDTSIIAELVGALKTASEEKLGKSLDGYAVSITAPWQQCWKNQGSWGSDINYALEKSGLQPWFPYTLDPVYLDEARTTLAASGRWLCEPFEDPTEKDDLSERVYYISFNNRSLYTTFTRRSCFGKQPIQDGGAIDSHLGLDRLNDTTPDEFWSALRERLHKRGKDLEDWIWSAKLLVVVTGEASHNPEFLSIIKDIAATLPRVIFGPRSQERNSEVGAELVVVDDPVSAPATGAALWSRLRVESGSYCETEDCVPPFLDLMPVTWGDSEDKEEL